MRNSNTRKSEKGFVAILMMVTLVALLGTASFAIDIGSALVTKAELQNSADAAVLAGNRELALIYRDLGSTIAIDNYSLTATDRTRILDKIQSFAGKNPAGGKALSVLPSDIVFGRYDASADAVVAKSKGVKAIALLTRRDESANDAQPTRLATVLGVEEINIRASAAAGLSPLASLPAGAGNLPIGISSYWFATQACGPNSSIRFYPTGDLDSCASWHTYTSIPASASGLNNILVGMQEGSYVSPETTAGETSFNFIGGALTSQFADMKKLYDMRKDASGNWNVVIPVYEDLGCSNPNQAKLIVGFATARIYAVTTAPEKTISANIDCGISDLGTGGGTNDYGTLLGIPGLLQ